jgi:hypothetical protein
MSINARSQPTHSCGNITQNSLSAAPWWPRMLSFENAELLSKSQILEEQVAARAKQSRKKENQEPQQA